MLKRDYSEMADQFTAICYKRNYITDVIARVDLLNPLTSIDTALPPAWTAVIARYFPIAEPRETFEQKINVDIAADKAETTKTKFMDWQFHGRERTKTLSISPKAIYINYKSYNSSDEIRREFEEILSAICSTASPVMASRFGLRYINSIAIPLGHPLDWTPFLKGNLISVFDFPPTEDRPFLSRVFHSMEIAHDDYNLSFRFGMHNPDYPAPIRQKIFTLDFDAYAASIYELRDIIPLFEKLRIPIQTYFEASITPQLRELMNA
jgi:uncharacterized protein (TIGR04255 family)